MTQFCYLSSDVFQFGKQVLSFLRFLLEQKATVMFASESSDTNPDDLQFMSDGGINLHHQGSDRSLSITKFRGSIVSLWGAHTLRLLNTGIEVFPRLQPEQHDRDFVLETISSGVTELDSLLHGGIERGTVTVSTGPTGVGKTLRRSTRRLIRELRRSRFLQNLLPTF